MGKTKDFNTDIDMALLYLNQASTCLEKGKIIILNVLMGLPDQDDDNYNDEVTNAYESLNAKLYFLSDAVSKLVKESFQAEVS